MLIVLLIILAIVPVLSAALLYACITGRLDERVAMRLIGAVFMCGLLMMMGGLLGAWLRGQISGQHLVPIGLFVMCASALTGALIRGNRAKPLSASSTGKRVSQPVFDPRARPALAENDNLAPCGNGAEGNRAQPARRRLV